MACQARTSQPGTFSVISSCFCSTDSSSSSQTCNNELDIKQNPDARLTISSRDGMVCSVPTVGALGEHLAPLLQTDGNAVTDRATQYLPHRVFVTLFQVQITVFFIAFEDALSLQKPGKLVLISQNRIFISQQFCESVNMFRTVKTILVVLACISHHPSTAATLCRTPPDFHSVRALNIV